MTSSLLDPADQDQNETQHVQEAGHPARYYSHVRFVVIAFLTGSSRESPSGGTGLSREVPAHELDPQYVKRQSRQPYR